MTVTFQRSPQSQARQSVRESPDASGPASVPRYRSQRRESSDVDGGAEASADIQPVRTQAANESRQLSSDLDRANPGVGAMSQAAASPSPEQPATSSGPAAMSVAPAVDGQQSIEQSPAAEVAEATAGTGQESAPDGQAGAANDESAADEPPANTTSEPAVPRAPAAANGGGGAVFDDLSISAADVGVPRLGIRTPRVASPPRPSIERSEDIRKRTGSPPELHHAQVRQSVGRVADTARGAQRRIVTDIGHLASRTRLTLEDMADEIPGVVSAAVAFIQRTVDEKQAEVEAVAERQQQHIADYGVLTGEHAQAERDRIAMEMHQRLMADSAEVQAALPLLEDRFFHHADQAMPLIRQLPTSGIAEPLPMPPPLEGRQSGGRAAGRGGGTGGGNDGANQQQDGDNDSTEEPQGPKTPADAMFDLVEDLVDMASFVPITEPSDAVLSIGNGGGLAAYKISRGSQINIGRFEIEDREIRQRQDETAMESQSPGNLSRFSMMAMGLTAPLAEQNQSRPLPEVEESGVDLQQRVANQQIAEAQDVLADRSERAGRKLQEDIGPTLKKNIRKTGRKIHRAFRKQALATERALNKTRVSMADAYRDLVQRLRPMLPPDRFLDARALIPKLDAARQSVMELYSGQIDDAEKQAAEAIDKTRKAQRDRTDDIWKAARKSLGTVDDAVTRTRFSFAQFASEKTGVLSEDGLDVIGDAAKFAAKIAGALTGRNEKLKAEGFQQVDRAAVSFFNGYIRGAKNYQYRRVSDYVEQMTAIPAGPIYQEYSSIEKLLNGRADDVDNALPTRSLLAAGGLTLASPIAAGVYLYHTDADEDEVIKALGDLPLLAGPAIKDVWGGKGHDDTMEGRIRDRMDNPEKRHALGLISGDAGKAGTARLGIARESTKWYGFNLSYDREARESALRGLTEAQLNAAEGLNPGTIANTREYLEDGLWSHQEDISVAYLDGNRERAVAAMARERMADARSSIEFAYWPGYEERIRRESDAEVIAATEKIDEELRRELQVESAFTVPDEFNRNRDEVFREYVALENPRRLPSSASDEEARQVFLQYITDDRDTYVVNAPLLIGFGVPGVLNPVTAAAVVDPTPMSMDSRAAALVTAIVNKGPNHRDVIAPRMAYEIHRARTEGGDLSEDTQTRLTNALENRAYYNLQREVQALAAGSPERADKEAQLLVVEQRHQARLLEVARMLGAPDDQIGNAEQATTWLSNEVGRQFARNHSVHRAYGQELVTQGRASLVAGVELATRGSGTHDDLLRSTYQDRSKAEISEANAQWKREHDGEDMEVMLGIRERPRDDLDRAVGLVAPFAPGVAIASWMIRGPETSGDLAMELTRLARGNPENDRDRVELAALRATQEREQGTGFIARQSMRGTPEAETLDGRRRNLAELMLASASGNENLNAEDREWLLRAESNPASVFGPDGRIDGRLNRLAFNGDGEFNGDRLAFNLLTDRTTIAADSYRAEIDRQEAMLTSAITWLAIAVSVVLMVVPVVNVAAAGILTALIAGSATMLAKYGMRGERYGWEEAATDLAMMGIEAATAGIGGAMVGEFGANLLVKPMLKLGNALGRLGKVGSAAARESITGAIASAAQIAVQDETWSKGPDAALDRIIKGSVRGAAVAAVTAGASESASNRLRGKMNLAAADDAAATPLRRAAPRMGRNTSEMMQEGVSEAIGAVAGEATAIIFEISSGEYKGGLKGALERIGAAGLRDMMSGIGRTAARQHNTRRYRALLSAARRSGKVSDADLRALHFAGISAGDIKYGDGIDSVRAELGQWKKMADRIPPSLHGQVDGFDLQTLQRLANVLEGGDGVTPMQRAEFYRSIHDKYGDFDIGQFRRDVIGAREQARADAAARDVELQQQKRLRNDLIGGVRGPARKALRNLSVDGFDVLTPAEIKVVADMIRAGRADVDAIDALMTAAKTRDSSVDADSLRKSLDRAVEMSREAQDIEAAARAKARSDLGELVPDSAGDIVGRLPDKTVGRIQKLLSEGSAGSPQQQESLFAAARRSNPDLTRDQFRAFMEGAAETSRQRTQTAKDLAREQRKERMSNVPPEERGTLSVLPDHLLIELRVVQSQGGEISPAERLRFLEAAHRHDPDLDIESFNQSLDRAAKVQAGEQVSGRQQREMRRELVAAIPPAQRHLVRDVPIVRVSDAEFAALTRSGSGQAVTMIIHGRPVVVIREGADPVSLREEGIHALQIKDPKWTDHVGALTEEELEHWDDMSIEQQLAAYNSKVALEIDAQKRLLDSLDAADGDNAFQRDLVRTALENLERRAREVADIGPSDVRRMEAGLLPRPQWLDQAARLFNKKKDGGANTSDDPDSRRSDDAEPAEDTASTVGRLKLDSGVADKVITHIDGSADSAAQLAAVRSIAESLPKALRSEVLATILRQENSADTLRMLASVIDSTPKTARRKVARLAVDPDVLAVLRSLPELGADSVARLLRAAPTTELAKKVLRTADRATDEAAYIDNLVSILKGLDQDQRKAVLTQLTRNTTDVYDLAATLRSVTDLKAAPEEVRGAIVDATIGSFARNDLEGRKTYRKVVHDIPDLARRAGMSEEVAARLLLGALGAAQDLSRTSQVLNSTLKLLEQVIAEIDRAKRAGGENKEAELVLDYLVARLTGEPLKIDPEKPELPLPRDAELRHVGTDIQAAANDIPNVSTKKRIDRLASSIRKRGRMIKSNTWELRLERAHQEWQDFSSKPENADFVALLKDVAGDMEERQMAILAKMKPWFDYYVKTMLENDARRMAELDELEVRHRAGDLDDDEVLALTRLRNWLKGHTQWEAKRNAIGLSLEQQELGRIIKYGYTDGQRLTESGFDRIMKELRRDAAGIEGDFDDWSELAKEMRRLGIDESEIEERLGDAGFDKRMEDLKAGRISVEDHLLGLVQQREEYTRIIRIAEDLGLSTSGLTQKLTEVKGELAATLAMVKMKHPEHGSYELIRGFASGTGFDQVWILRDGDRIVEIVIMEAKGPEASTQGTSTKGHQMSPEWVAKTIIENFARDPNEALRLIDAIEDEAVKVRGLIVEANEDGTPREPTTAEGTDKTQGDNFGVYPQEGEDSLPEALREAAKALSQG